MKIMWLFCHTGIIRLKIEDIRRNRKKDKSIFAILYFDYLPLYKYFVKFIDPSIDKYNFILIIFLFFEDTHNVNETMSILNLAL